MLSQQLTEANTQVSAAESGLIDDRIDEADLMNQIIANKATLTQLSYDNSIWNSTNPGQVSRPNNYQRNMEISLKNENQKLQESLDSMNDFDLSTKYLYDGILSSVDLYSQLIDQVSDMGKIYDESTGQFTTKNINMELVTGLQGKFEQYQEESWLSSLSEEQKVKINEIINDPSKSSEEKESLLESYLKEIIKAGISDKLYEKGAELLVSKLSKEGLEGFLLYAVQTEIGDGVFKLTNSMLKQISVRATEEGIEITTIKLVQVSAEEGAEKIIAQVGTSATKKIGSKALGPVIGGVVSAGVNIYNGDDPAKAVTKAAVGTAVQVGVAAAFTAIPIPGATFVGFAVGVGLSMATDAIIDRYWDDPIGQASKDLQSVGNAVGNFIGGIGRTVFG